MNFKKVLEVKGITKGAIRRIMCMFRTVIQPEM